METALGLGHNTKNLSQIVSTVGGDRKHSHTFVSPFTNLPEG